MRIANNNMINALKLVSVNRGYDPRDFTLVAFGGGGGMHAVALAAELGIRKVAIPRAADVFSAWGMLMSDLRRDYFVTRLTTLTPENAPRVDALLAEMTQTALDQFGREGIGPEQVRFVRFGNLRYENQEHSVEVPLPDGAVDEAAIDADRRQLPRLVRARVHLPPRRAGRVRRRARRRDRRGGQAHARAAAGDRAARSATRSRAGATSTTRPKACTRRTSTQASCSSPG